MIVRDLVTKLSFLVDPKGLEKLDQELAKVRGGLLAIGAAGTAAFAVLAKMAAKQEEAVTRAAQETGLTGQAFENVTENLRKLTGEISSVMGVTSEEVNKVFGAALDRGFKETDDRFREITTTVLRLSKVTGQDAAQSFRLLGQISQQFFGSFDQIEQIGNVLTQTAIESTAEFGELAEFIVKMGPQATRTGTSVEQLSAIVGTLADSGIPARRVMGVLVQIMDAIIEPSDDVRSIMSELNMEFTDLATGAPKNLIQILTEIESRTATLNQTEREFVLSKLAGAQGVTVFNALLKKGAKEVSEVEKRLKNSNIVNEQYAQLLQTSNMQLEIAASSISQVGQAIGVALLAPLSRAAGSIAALAQRIRTWIEDNREVANRIIVVTAALFASLSAIAAFAFAVGTLTKILAFFSVPAALVVAKVLLIAAAIAGVILVIEDLYQWITGGDSVFKRMAESWGEAVNSFINSRPVLRNVIDLLGMIFETAIALPKLFGDLARSFDNLVKGNFSDALKNLTDGRFATDAGAAFDNMRQKMQVTESVRSAQATVNISNLQVPPGTDPQDVGNVVGDKVVGYLESLRMARSEFEPQMVQ